MNIPTSSFPTDTDQTGILLIRSLGIPPMDAFLLLKDLLDTSRGRGDRITRAKRCIRLGGEALADRETSVPFSQAVRASLEARKHRRPRTLQEIRYMAARMMKKCPELARKQVRSITPEDCERYLRKSFSTPRQRHKGRLILSGILNFSLKRGWCRRNAAFLVPPPILREKRIRALSLYEAKRLLHGTVVPRGMPAGLRPDAVRGHTPPRSQKADLEAHQPEIRPGFTGAQPYQNRREPPCFHPSRAGRHPQPDVFRRFPRPSRLPAQLGKEMDGSKAPVLKKSGWVQDVLRHTYASYHLAHFCNQNLLQKEMGHSSPSLLLARYLNMDGITSATGAMFWTHSFIPPAPLKKN